MPTAAKLIAAVTFALAALIVSEVFKTTVPERTVWGEFTLINAGIGLLCGWFVMGPLAGHGYMAAMGYGARTIVTVVFWALLVFAIHDMILRSMNLRYDGPMKALLGAVGLMLDYGRTMLTVPTITSLFFGGLVAGWLTEWGGRRWS